jgi:hypothetical protein
MDPEIRPCLENDDLTGALTRQCILDNIACTKQEVPVDQAEQVPSITQAHGSDPETDIRKMLQAVLDGTYIPINPGHWKGNGVTCPDLRDSSVAA